MSIYLDHAATTPAEECVIEAMVRCMRMANPSAAYSAAGEGRKEMRLCRMQIAKMLHVDHAAVFFTSGSSGLGNSMKHLEEQAGAGTWLVGRRFTTRTTVEELTEWAASLGIKP